MTTRLAPVGHDLNRCNTMNRFEAFEDLALEQRLKRLTRSERDLRERILNHAVRGEALRARGPGARPH